MNMKENIQSAVLAFNVGKLVGIPTETVYGLAAPFDEPRLIQKIFELKGRPLFDPLIVHVANTDQAKQLVSSWPDHAQKLANQFWPGPLTLILPKQATVSDLITAGLDTVGIRCPDHQIALDFIQELKRPFVAPSANLFKKTSPTSAAHVAKSFHDDQVYILDGGDCQVGIESTILKIEKTGVIILRPGAIKKSDIEALGITILENTQSHEQVLAPGMLEEHYMPDKPLLLILEGDENKMKSWLKQHGLESFNQITLNENPMLASRELYKKLHLAGDKQAIICILKREWLNNPDWNAILDRLTKAATTSLLP